MLLQNEWLFCNKVNNGHIKLRTADAVFREAVGRAGLAHKGYSTHSTRRTFITRLHERGCDIHTIQRITGHQDLRSLVRYVDISAERLAQAIAVL